MAKKVKKTQAKKATSKAAPKKNANKVAKKIVAKKAVKKTPKAATKKAATKKVVAKKTVTRKTVKKVTPKKSVKKVTKKTTPIRKLKTTEKTEGQTFGVNTSTNEAMEKIMTQSTTQFDKLAQEATGFGRENAEAFMKSSTIFAKGFENMLRTSMTLAQSSAEKQAQFVKEAMAVKSLNEFTDVQNKIAQSSMEDFMSNATKLSELGNKLLTEASEPINQQVNKAKKAA